MNIWLVPNIQRTHSKTDSLKTEIELLKKDIEAEIQPQLNSRNTVQRKLGSLSPDRTPDCKRMLNNHHD